MSCLVQRSHFSFSRVPATRTFTLWTTRLLGGQLPKKLDLLTAASRANVCHATGLTVAHLLGHASTQILPTYVRPLDENTRALIEAMDTARKNRGPNPLKINGGSEWGSNPPATGKPAARRF
jgi:hypothetical protein